MNIAQAKKISITEYLRAIGIRPVKENDISAWYHAPHRADCTPSFKVNKNINLWYDFATRQNGDLIDLCKIIYKTGRTSEVLKLIEENTHIPEMTFNKSSAGAASQAFTDVKTGRLRSTPLLSYLRERCIDIDIAMHECSEIRYRRADKRYYAIGFRNASDGFEIRNKYFKGCIPPKDITFVSNGNGRECCLFEGFFDYLSYLTMIRIGWIAAPARMPDHLILNTTANLQKAIPHLIHYEVINSFLDNDNSGQRAYAVLREKCGYAATDMMSAFSEYDDLNDVLCRGGTLP
jgi:hypothetical protein